MRNPPVIDAEFVVVRGPRRLPMHYRRPRRKRQRRRLAPVLWLTAGALALRPVIYFGAHLFQHLRAYWPG